MSRSLDTTSGDWQIVRASLRGSDSVWLLVSLLGFSGMSFFLCVLAAAEPKGLAPIALPIVLGTIGAVLLIAPFLEILTYFVAMSDDYVAAGRKRAKLTAWTERHQVACVIQSSRSWRVEQFELCGTDGTTLLLLDRWISAEQAAQIARTLNVPFSRVSAKYREEHP